MSNSTVLTTGRRKTASARVFLRKGNGQVFVNKKPLNDFFQRETARMIVMQPLVALNSETQFDVHATVIGGGKSGQAGAIRHGIARALIAYENGETRYRIMPTGNTNLDTANDANDSSEGDDDSATKSWRKVLREAGYVTRDSRSVERKKYGLKKARKRPQYSKR